MLFYGKLPTISEHSKKTFFLGYFLAEVRSSGLEACNVSEKEDFCKYFLGIFESFENSFLSELFKKNICSGVFRLAVGCRLYSCNRIKKELYYIHFSRYFPKFFQCSFQHTLIKLSVTIFIEFLAVPETDSWNFLRWNHPIKKSAMDSCSGSNLQYF